MCPCPRHTLIEHTGVLNQSPFIRCRIPTCRTLALMSVCMCLCEQPGARLHLQTLAVDWSVQKLWRFCSCGLECGDFVNGGMLCESERKLVPERFSGQKVFVVCAFFSSFPIRFVLRQWHLSFLLHSVIRLKCEMPCGELDQIRHLPCFLSCSACACGCHASTFNLLSQQLYKWKWKQSATYTANDKALTAGMNEWNRCIVQTGLRWWRKKRER